MESKTNVKINGRLRIVGVFFTRANERKENFRCPVCGKLLMVHNGSLEAIGYIAPKIDSEFGTDVMCNRCKIIYRMVYN